MGFNQNQMKSKVLKEILSTPYQQVPQCKCLCLYYNNASATQPSTYEPISSWFRNSLQLRCYIIEYLNLYLLHYRVSWVQNSWTMSQKEAIMIEVMVDNGKNNSTIFYRHYNNINTYFTDSKSNSFPRTIFYLKVQSMPSWEMWHIKFECCRLLLLYTEIPTVADLDHKADWKSCNE